VLLFGTLAVVCHAVADQNEQRLLQEQTDQAGAVLTTSIGQVQAPLQGALLLIRFGDVAVEAPILPRAPTAADMATPT
jgi:hypothetical protein